MSSKIKIYRKILQRTDAWVQIKAGKTSGTGMKPILTARSKGPLETYAYDLISQTEVTEKPVYIETYLSVAVQHGVDDEPFAIKEFEKKYNLIVEEVGWVESLDKKLKGKCGYSPDGIITVKEHVEVKCLSTKNHIQCVTKNEYPKEYKPQVLNYFICNEDLKKVYFILYDPRVKIKSKQLHVIEILREDLEKEIKEGYCKLVSFLELKEELHKKYLK